MNESWVFVLKSDDTTEYQLFEIPPFTGGKLLRYSKTTFIFLLKVYMFYF